MENKIKKIERGKVFFIFIIMEISANVVFRPLKVDIFPTSQSEVINFFIYNKRERERKSSIYIYIYI